MGKTGSGLKNLFVLFIIAQLTALASIGLADWEVPTPLGNSINNFSGLSLYLRNGNSVENLKEWYFYKQSIIGTIQRPGSDSIAYFTANEHTGQTHYFTLKSEWELFLYKNNLVPVLWTRWYHTNWAFFDHDVLIWLFLGFFISVPIIVMYLLLLWRAIKREDFHITQPNTLIFCTITFLLLLKWISELYPQSI